MRTTPSTIEGGGSCSLLDVILFVGKICLDTFRNEQTAINQDALNCALLLFYPPAALTRSSLTYSTKMGVREMKKFRTLVGEVLGHMDFGPRCGGARGPPRKPYQYFGRSEE